MNARPHSCLIGSLIEVAKVAELALKIAEEATRNYTNKKDLKIRLFEVFFFRPCVDVMLSAQAWEKNVASSANTQGSE